MGRKFGGKGGKFPVEAIRAALPQIRWISDLSLSCEGLAFFESDRYKSLMKICLFGIFSFFPAIAAFSQQPSIDKIAEGELPSLLAIYKDIHSHPELSAHEERTSALIAKELRAVGCDVTEHFGQYDRPELKGYGVIGLMKNGDGPTVLVRTDMDALPVEEETGLPYASKVATKSDEGKDVHVMHACGH